MSDTKQAILRLRMLSCTCCGEYIHGRQWHNLDIGFGGPCAKCIPLCSRVSSNTVDGQRTPEDMERNYGVRGYHWDVQSTPLKFHGNGAAYLAAMNSGDPFETDEESYDYWLGVLPPAYMHRTVQLPNGETVRAHFGFVEGEDYITAFWTVGGRFFGCRTNQVSRG